jgi:hypothetical protein
VSRPDKELPSRAAPARRPRHVVQPRRPATPRRSPTGPRGPGAPDWRDRAREQTRRRPSATPDRRIASAQCIGAYEIRRAIATRFPGVSQLGRRAGNTSGQETGHADGACEVSWSASKPPAENAARAFGFEPRGEGIGPIGALERVAVLRRRLPFRRGRVAERAARGGVREHHPTVFTACIGVATVNVRDCGGRSDQRYGGAGRGPRCEFHGAAGAGYGLSRPERGGQVHHHEDDLGS